MAFQQKENSFSLFENDKRERDTHPQWRGTLNVDGVEYFMDVWENKTKEGALYFSGKVKKKDRQPGRSDSGRGSSSSSGSTYRGQSADTRPMSEQVDDDIPF